MTNNARTFWDGTGELLEGQVHFTTDEGILRGRPYVRQRVAKYLASGRGLKWVTTPAERAAIVAATVDNDAWLAPKNGCLVSYVCRAAADHYYTYGVE